MVSIGNRERQYGIDQVLQASVGNKLDVFQSPPHSSIPQGNSEPNTQVRETTGIFISEYLLLGNACEKFQQFKVGKEKDVQGLRDHNVYKVVNKSSVEKGTYIFEGMFVLYIKEKERQRNSTRHVTRFSGIKIRISISWPILIQI